MSPFLTGRSNWKEREKETVFKYGKQCWALSGQLETFGNISVEVTEEGQGEGLLAKTEFT